MPSCCSARVRSDHGPLFARTSCVSSGTSRQTGESNSAWSTGVGFLRPMPKLIRPAISSASRPRSSATSAKATSVRTAITPQPMSYPTPDGEVISR